MQTLTNQQRADHGTGPSLAPAIAASVAIVVAVVGSGVGVGVGVGVAVATALASGAAGAVVDARTGRIPDRFVLVALAPVAIVVLVESVTGPGVSVLAAAATGAAVFAAPLLGLHLVVPGAIGFGDVKLAAVLGSALGLVDARLGLVALCVACGSTALVGVLSRRRVLPLGPGLVLGAAVAVALAGRAGGPLPWR